MQSPAAFESQALDLAKDNILVNAVCPGFFLTDRMKSLIEEKAKKSKRKFNKAMEEMVSQIPLGRMGNPEELANLIVFLASERASYITGSIIQVDGGVVKGLM